MSRPSSTSSKFGATLGHWLYQPADQILGYIVPFLELILQSYMRVPDFLFSSQKWRYSTVFISGLFAGHFINPKFWITLIVCDVAISCCKMKFSPYWLMKGYTIGCRILSMYHLDVRKPFAKTWKTVRKLFFCSK